MIASARLAASAARNLRRSFSSSSSSSSSSAVRSARRAVGSTAASDSARAAESPRGAGARAGPSKTASTSSSSPDEYLYPLRKEAPVVSRTLATEAAAAVEDPPPDPAADADDDDGDSESAASAPRLRPGDVDRFDDLGTIPPTDAARILKEQKSSLRTDLDPAMRIGSDPPLAVPPNLPSSTMEAPETSVTALDNGIRVASIETYGQVCTVGVLSNCGSRYEINGKSGGVNHLMEVLAFRSTSAFPDPLDITHRVDDMGGATFASSGREQMLYCVDVLRPNADSAVEILAETVLRPNLTEEEVEDAKRTVEFQNLDVIPEVRMGEGLQVAGYGPLDGGTEQQQLGRPHLCPPEALPLLDARAVREFRDAHLLVPSEMVIAGAGIGHDELVDLATKYFGSVPPSDPPRRDVPSKYTGGEYRLRVETVDGFTRLAVAFEVGGWRSPDLVPACVLQTLLGGGNSFSAGGPGKGMYSRLYREVLNRYQWAESAEAFTSFHSESGLVGISASSAPGRSGDAARVVAEHLGRLGTDPVSDEELDRARNMLKCNVLTQLESRLVLFEDVGRQILTYGGREDSATMCGRIEAVTKEDIRDLARRAIAGIGGTVGGGGGGGGGGGVAAGAGPSPTLSTVGDDLGGVPSQEELAGWFR